MNATAGLSVEAREILLAATKAASRKGQVLVARHQQGMALNMGDQTKQFAVDDMAGPIKCEEAISELIACGLLTQRSANLYLVTPAGYLAAG